MDREILTSLNEQRANRRAAIVVTEIKTGSSRLITENQSVEPEFSDAVSRAFKSGKSVLRDISDTQYFLNVHVPPPRLVAIGAVHISQALVPIARTAGYDLEIIDPRMAFATTDRFEGVKLHAEWPETVLKTHCLDPYTALAAITHDPKIDDFALLEALRVGCFYVGALGSRKTHAKRVDRLSAAGASIKDIENIHSPIGLDIGAATPAEIAVSIMAQVIDAFRRRGLAGSNHGQAR